MNHRQCRPTESRLAYAAFVKGVQTDSLARIHQLSNCSYVALFHQHIYGIEDYSGPCHRSRGTIDAFISDVPHRFHKWCWRPNSMLIGASLSSPVSNKMYCLILTYFFPPFFSERSINNKWFKYPLKTNILYKIDYTPSNDWFHDPNMLYEMAVSLDCYKL